MKPANLLLVLCGLALALPVPSQAQSGAGQVFQYADKALALAQIRWAGETCNGISIDAEQLETYRAEEPKMPVDASPEIEGYIWGASQTWQQVVFLSNPEFWCGRMRLIGELEPDINSTLAILYESARALNQVLIFSPDPSE